LKATAQLRLLPLPHPPPYYPLMRVNPTSFTLTKNPAFIAFEGINGCGKTTLHRLVSQHLRAAGAAVVDTREPGGTELGKEIRKLVLEWPGEKKSDRAELLLFAADRAEHVDKVISPALSRGDTVLCDRYLYSTITFQGHGRGINRQWIDQANALATQGVVPDLVILLDIDPTLALQRIASRTGNGRDSFEDEELEFHARIRRGFLECADTLPAPFLVLDATASPEQLFAQCITVLQPLLASKHR
jgi:dTMP kinase